MAPPTPTTPSGGSISGTIYVGQAAARWQLDETADFVPGELVVKLRPDQRRHGATIDAAGLRLDRERPLAVPGSAMYRVALDGAVTAAEQRERTLAAVRALANDPDVEYAVPNYKAQALATPTDEYARYQWHYAAANLPQAWDMTTGAASTVVAVLDTGILFEAGNTGKTHPDFTGKVLPGYDFITDPASARDGNGRDANAFDDGDLKDDGFQSSYHGSHCAGTIAARSNDGGGVAGVDWQAKILPIRVLGANGGNSVDIYEGLLWAAGVPVNGLPPNPNPAHVINMSLGGQYACPPDTQAAIDTALAKGAIIVVAAGNSNIDASMFTPASCRGVITVGATDFANVRAPYSNYGTRIDVMAPGGDISADRNGDNFPDGVLSPWRNDYTGRWDYSFENGTSMAAPHVAGIISLMKAVKPTLTATEALAALKNTARPLTATQCNANSCGAGLVDAYAALQAVKSGGGGGGPGTGDGTPKGSFVVAAVTPSGEIVEYATSRSFQSSYELEVASGSYVVVAWTDENGNDEVDGGDFYGETPELSIDDGQALTGVDLGITPLAAATDASSRYVFVID